MVDLGAVVPLPAQGVEEDPVALFALLCGSGQRSEGEEGGRGSPDSRAHRRGEAGPGGHSGSSSRLKKARKHQPVVTAVWSPRHQGLGGAASQEDAAAQDRIGIRALVQDPTAGPARSRLV